MTARQTLVRWHDPQEGLARLPELDGIDTLLDSALGCATHTLLPAGTGYTSIEIKTNFLRPVTLDSGPLTCAGRVVKPGRRVTFADGEVVDKDGKTVATASSSLLIFPLDTV